MGRAPVLYGQSTGPVWGRVPVLLWTSYSSHTRNHHSDRPNSKAIDSQILMWFVHTWGTLGWTDVDIWWHAKIQVLIKVKIKSAVLFKAPESLSLGKTKKSPYSGVSHALQRLTAWLCLQDLIAGSSSRWHSNLHLYNTVCGWSLGVLKYSARIMALHCIW